MTGDEAAGTPRENPSVPPQVTTADGPHAERTTGGRTPRPLKPQRLLVRMRDRADVRQIGSLCRYVTHAQVLVPRTRLPRTLGPMWRRKPGVGQGFYSPLRPEPTRPPTTGPRQTIQPGTAGQDTGNHRGRGRRLPRHHVSTRRNPALGRQQPINCGAFQAGSNAGSPAPATPHHSGQPPDHHQHGTPPAAPKAPSHTHAHGRQQLHEQRQTSGERAPSDYGSIPCAGKADLRAANTAWSRRSPGS